jgi:hypothetical protein
MGEERWPDRQACAAGLVLEREPVLRIISSPCLPLAGRKLQVEHAVANCIAFGSRNSAMVLRRV